MLRYRTNITIDKLAGVDLSESENKLEPGKFLALENLVPLGLRSLQRKPGSIIAVTAEIFQLVNVVDNLGNLVIDNSGNQVVTLVKLQGGSSAGRIVRLHTFSRVGQPDELLAIVSRPAQTDALLKRLGSNWVLVGSLAATGAKYDTVTWQGKVYITDGTTNDPQTYNGSAIGTLTDVSVPTRTQYCTVHQDRLILAGGPDNRDKVWFSNVLTEVFGATAFHTIKSGTGGEISGLGVNSITTSTQGAQTHLVVLKTDSVAAIAGVLGSAQETIAIQSAKIGCPSHKTIVNSPFGMIFMGQNSVYLLDQSGREPIDIGAELGKEIVRAGVRANSAAIFYNNFYHLSIPGPGGVGNTREWMLNLNAKVFPNAFNWYGPHSGDEISNYAVADGELYGAQESSIALWKLLVQDNHFSMLDQVTPRRARMVTGKFIIPDLKGALFDAMGLVVGVVQGASVTLSATVSSLTASGNGGFGISGGGNEGELLNISGVGQQTMVWDSSLWDQSQWAGVRTGPIVARIRLHGNDIGITAEHQRNEPFEIHAVLIRIKGSRRQQER